MAKINQYFADLSMEQKILVEAYANGVEIIIKPDISNQSISVIFTAGACSSEVRIAYDNILALDTREKMLTHISYALEMFIMDSNRNRPCCLDLY